MSAAPAPAEAVVTPLARADGPRFGGKARGLHRLLALGLPVPDGFVLTGAEAGAPLDADALRAAYAALGGGPVAVRSSATCEDGAEASAAGQFDTFLDVEGADAVVDATARCLASLDGEAAAAYRAARGDADGDASMAVVVQRMVRARISGVLFSQDPTPGGDRTRMRLEAVAGQGEALVSGHAAALALDLPREGPVSAPLGDGPVQSNLTPAILGQLRDQAMAAEARLETPLDLEWSVDADGTLYWLQARPITTLDQPGLDELDLLPAEGVERLFTRANVGEMLPGAATPLTISVFAHAVDHAMHDFYRRAGGIAPADRDEPMICVVQNHLFFNLRLLYQIVGRVGGATPEGVEIGLLGREADDRPAVRRSSGLTRGLNLARYAVFVSRHGWAKRRIRSLLDGLHLPDEGSAAERYADLDRAVTRYVEITDRHIQVSARSGALTSAVREVLAKAGLSRTQQFEALGALMSGIDGIESAELMRDLDAIADEARRALATTPMDAETFATWLQETTHPTGERFAAFLRDHGHRCVREAELRELAWAADPGELAEQLWVTANAPARPAPPPVRPWEAVIDDLREAFPDLSRRAAVWLTRNAREAVKDREASKSMLIRAGHRLREAYRALAWTMVQDGLLPDEDLVFFLTHQELGAQLRADDPAPAVSRARHRRRLYPQQMNLRFPDFCRGVPTPESDAAPPPDGDTFEGLAVSPGRVRGPVRVVHTKADAKALQPGEIICARFTDVGWTPYYATAAGLVTEIGSALSHGAVVAREYGLPLVTSIEGATRILRTGDVVELDGTAGRVTRVDEDAEGAPQA